MATNEKMSGYNTEILTGTSVSLSVQSPFNFVPWESKVIVGSVSV